MVEFIFDIAQKRAQLSPEKIAFKDYSTKREISFCQFNQRANKAAAILSIHNILAGDRVAILCRNRIEFFEILFACAKIGAVLVPLNWRAPAPELAPLLSMSGAKIIFYGNEDALIGKIIGDKIPQINFDDDYEDSIEKIHEHVARAVWPSNETWYLLFTSGTTGAPKAVIQTYGMALINSINLGQAININANDCFLNFLPLFHTAGINLHTLPAFFNGCLSWIIDGFNIDSVVELIGNGQISMFFAVPAVYLQIANHEKFNSLDLSKIRHWGCGGAPLPDYLVNAFAQKSVLVCNGMGMTETGPTAFMMDSDNVLSKIGSVGKPQILIEARIIDNNLNPVENGQSGELVFAGPGITPGYWNNSAANEAAFFTDTKTNIRYLRTGDLARIDDDGYFYITGRAKEMYISGGENVYPMEVENILSLHDAVAEVAIIGVPDEKWGETGAAFIMAAADHSLNIEELKKFCRDRLAPFKAPKYFIPIEDFPRTAAGKIQKHLLKLPT